MLYPHGPASPQVQHSPVAAVFYVFSYRHRPLSSPNLRNQAQGTLPAPGGSGSGSLHPVPMPAVGTLLRACSPHPPRPGILSRGCWCPHAPCILKSPCAGPHGPPSPPPAPITSSFAPAAPRRPSLSSPRLAGAWGVGGDAAPTWNRLSQSSPQPLPTLPKPSPEIRPQRTRLGGEGEAEWG